jgi:hypothetical protein
MNKFITFLLLNLAVGTASAATVTTLNTLADWDVYGSASTSGSTLIFGDTVGYDSSDSDKDGNPSNVWNEGSATAGQALDYDWQVAKKDFKRPFTVEWSGCLPVTRYGYNWMSIGLRDTTFRNGSKGANPMRQGTYFMSSWEARNQLSVLTGDMSAPQIVSSASASSNGICGDFAIDWTKDLVTFSYNGKTVYQRNYPAWTDQPLTIAFRSFENAFSITSFKVTEKDAVGAFATPKLAVSKLDFGAVKQGTSSDLSVALSNAGNADLPLAPANVAISGDFAYSSDCGTVLAAGKSCTLRVSFAPQATGVRSGTLSIVDGSGVSLASLALSGSGTAGQSFLGSFGSQVTAQVTDSNGQSKASRCTASTDLSALESSGALTANASGTVVCEDGVLVTYTAAFDVASQALSGTFSDNLGNSNKPITFTPTGAALTWTASISGTGSKAGQPRAYQASVLVTLPPQAIYAGKRPSNSFLSGPIKATNPISIPLNIPQIGINQTLDFNVIVDGSWQVDVVPNASGATITGKVSGTVKGDQEFHLKGQVDISSYIPAGVPLPPGFSTKIEVPVDIVINESFAGTLFGDAASNNLAFKGYFTRAGQSVSLDLKIPFDANGNPPSNLQLVMGGNFNLPVPTPSAPSGIPMPDLSQLVPSSANLPANMAGGLIPFSIQQ